LNKATQRKLESVKRIFTSNSREVSCSVSQKSLYAKRSRWEELSLCSAQTEVALKESPLHNRSFEKLLLEAVDESLFSLGVSSKQAIYFHLEKTFDINKQEIPYKIEEFANAVEKIFGLGAKFLEIRIMKRLYEKVGLVFKYFPERDDLVFTEYVEAASYYFKMLSKDT